MGSTNTDECANRREGIAAVVPRIGYDRRALHTATDTHGVVVEGLLYDNRHGSRHNGNRPRAWQLLACDNICNALGTLDENLYADSEERNADNQRRKRFVLAVSPIVVLVAWLCADAHKCKDDDVGHKVRCRVYGVGNHCAASTHDTRCEFECEERYIDKHTERGCSVYLFYSVIVVICCHTVAV